METSSSKEVRNPKYKPRKNHSRRINPTVVPRKEICKRENKSIVAQRMSLPVFELKDKFIEAVRSNQILIVVGETGSGKSTQLTQYLVEAGFTEQGRIGCTQPRKVAAVSLAKRVAKEYGCRLGYEVGYAVRFDNCTTNKTIIKYMTEGILLRETLSDRNMSGYSCIMLDEAHERTINTDVLFGLLKETVRERSDLKLIITSATLDAAKFSTYFNQAPIFEIPGRSFPVEIIYDRLLTSDYLGECLKKILKIHRSEPPGDILVFMTGQEEIDNACEALEEWKTSEEGSSTLQVYPMYSALPLEKQMRIYEKPLLGCRKVIISTNIAETSLTIDGVLYVVDSGLCKQNVYNPHQEISTLQVTKISQAEAKQRSGRAGRTAPGKTYRLYTEDEFKNMVPTPIPEIKRSNLSTMVLQLKAMGINDLPKFDFMDPPTLNSLDHALEILHSLSAVTDRGLLTLLGKQMAELPVDPILSKMLLVSVDEGCIKEISSIVSLLSVNNNVFIRPNKPKEKQKMADEKKAQFIKEEGDILTLLEAYDSWIDNEKSISWCKENFLDFKTLKEAEAIRNQLLVKMKFTEDSISSCHGDLISVQRSICAGLIRNIASRTIKSEYSLGNQVVFIHPGSSVFQQKPDYVVCHEVVQTSKKYMRMLTIVEPRWEYEFKPSTSYVHLKSEKEPRKPRTPKPKLSEDPPSYESSVRHENSWAWHASSQFRPSAPEPPSFRPSSPTPTPTPTPTPQPQPKPSKSRCTIS